MRHTCTCLLRSHGLLFVMAAMLLGITGCGPQSTSTLDAACRDYRLGKYEAAMDGAMAARYTGTTRDREEASYVAGLSAARLGRNATARTMLEKAVVSSDRMIAGNANATLGTVLLDDGRPLEAARCFDRASDLLVGEDKDRARMDAGFAYKDAGRLTEARRRFDDVGGTSNATLRQRSRQEVARTGFAIQAGAFVERSNAVEHAGKVSAAASRVGMPEARIVTVQRGARTLHLVQLGSYPDRSWASTQRSRLDGALQGLTIVPVAVAD